MEIKAITVGAEALVKSLPQSFTGRHGVDYRTVTVTRVTKARVFVRAKHDGAPELEFRLDNLRRYGEKEWKADELVLDPALVAEARAEMAARKARHDLDVRAHMAVADLRGLFEGYAVHNRTDAEILLLADLRDQLFKVLGKTPA